MIEFQNMHFLVRQLTQPNRYAIAGDLLRAQNIEIFQSRGRLYCELVYMTVVGRKRALKQILSRQQRLERRLKREEREAARKQYTFMERINIRRMKSL